MLSKEQKQGLVAEAKALSAILQVGKKGLTDEFLAELDKTLEKKKLVKVKFLRSFADMNETRTIAEDIAGEKGYELILSVGNTATFYRS